MASTINDVLVSYAELTKVIKADLQAELAAQRITGDTYAQVYMQMMNMAMQQAVAVLASLKQADLLEEQVNSAKEQTKLVAQKIITEKAQVQDMIEELENITDAQGTVEGSIGKQKDVYDTQITAFRDKALQDFLNNQLNTWSVRRTTDPDTLASAENLLTDLDIGKCVKHVGDHLGFPLPDPKPKP